ncbi:MAG: inner membrane protein YpjD [Bacillota bacterium]
MAAASLGLVILALVLYAVSALAHGAYLYAEEWRRPSSFLLRLAFLAHTAALVLRIWQNPSHVPFLSMEDAALFFTWVVAVNYALLDLLHPVKIAGVFLIPVLVAFLLGTAAAPRAAMDVPALSGTRLVFHILFAYASYGLFALSFISGVMYLLQEKQLRDKAFFVLFYRLPPLDVLDRFGLRFIEAGYPLLTVGLVAGVFWAQAAWTSWLFEWKVIWSGLTWMLYGFYLLARLALRWNGRRAAYLSVVGFLAVMANFYIINLFASRLHGF